MFAPKKIKWRKPHKLIPNKKRPKVDRLVFGEFGLMVIENGHLSDRQIEAARRAIVGYMKRRGKLWIRVFPDWPITKRPGEVKLGGGKGNLDHYVALVKKGSIVFEVGGIAEEIALEALRRASYKLPLQTKIVKAK